MPTTNFPSGVTSMGVLAMGVSGLPGPFTGNYYFVNGTTGSDGNTGGATDPLATLARAQVLATAGQNDVVFFTGTVRLTSTLTWAKNQVHLIGLCNGIKRGKRARISVTGSTAFGPLVSVTASGCMFQNFGTFFGFTITGSSSPICWQDTGGRNMYDNVEFLGFGDDTVSTGTAVQTGARAFKFNTNTGETTWNNCVFGVDTAVRNATNYTVEIAGGAPRLNFIGCDFEAFIGSSGASSSHLLIGSGGIDRYAKFRACTFMNSTASTATTMTQALNIDASAGGWVEFDELTNGFGFTNWETSASGRLIGAHAVVATTDAGIAAGVVP